ncbi:MAG: S8 family serine peptidase [Acidobacteriaceae bacterium]|nr:S8 family serine peptidase [Acidobacteriaceae bacterium]MBV9296466.1 S8 family serine peptidase [Acidobacteriaceae bacterium]
MKRALCLLVIAVAGCWEGWSEGRPSGESAKLANELATVDPAANVDVIVQYKVPPRDRHFDRVHALGGTDKRRFLKIPAAAFKVPASALHDLANDPEVAYISLDRKVRSHLDLSAAAIDAATAWSSGYTGTGIGVAVIDSGINGKVQDLGNSNGQTDPAHTRIVYAENFLTPATNPNGNPNPAHYQTNDGYGHGTHVAGIIAGNGFLSSGVNATTTYKGIAPTANLIDLQVLDANGEGQDSTVIAAIEEAINLKSTYNIRVINLSLGRPVYESFALDPLCQAVEQAWKAGIVVVVAAGNDGRDNSVENGGYGTINAPGNDPYVLTVGAMNAKFTPFAGDDVITTYTSRGPTMVDHIVKPDIVAPGNHISSLLNNSAYLPKTYPQNIVNTLVYETQGGGQSYLILNGTSMATGVVSGAVADLLSANANLTPDQVKAVLMLSATKQFRTYNDAYYSLAALSYGQNAQLQQAQQQLQQAQGQINPTASQAANAQQQAAQKAAQAQTAATNYNTAVQQTNAVAAQLATAQSNFNSANAAYTLANQQLATANQAVTQAQAAVQSAQQAQGAAGNGTGKTAAQAALSQAQANLNAAQTALQAANNVAHNAQNALNQAQGALNQAQNNVNNANNQAQHALNAMDQANADSSNAAQAAATAQAAAQTAAQTLAASQNLVTSLEVPAATMQSQLQQMQSDSTQYTDTQYDVFTVGAGYLNLKAALANVSNAPSGFALSPVAYVDPASGQVYASANYAGLCQSSGSGSSSSAVLGGSDLCTSSVANLTSLWQFDAGNQIDSTSSVVSGTKCLWGAGSVWGSAAFTSGSSTVAGSKCLWGANSIWGASSTQAFKCLWGAGSIWGASASGAASTDSASNVLATGDTN